MTDNGNKKVLRIRNANKSKSSKFKKVSNKETEFIKDEELNDSNNKFRFKKNENQKLKKEKATKSKNKTFTINKDVTKKLNLKKKENKKFEDVFKPENITDSLKYLYDDCLENGNIQNICDKYLKKYSTKEKACKAMLRDYILKCSSEQVKNQFADIEDFVYIVKNKKAKKDTKNEDVSTSISEIQMEMVVCAAYIGGYDLNTEYIKNAACFCLCGIKVGDVLREFGINSKNLMLFAFSPSNKDIFTKMNKMCGSKFLTSNFKDKLRPILSKLENNKKLGLIVKFAPLIGLVVASCIDFGDTRTIANNAYSWFIEDDLNKAEDDKVDIFKDEFEDVERLRR